MSNKQDQKSISTPWGELSAMFEPNMDKKKLIYGSRRILVEICKLAGADPEEEIKFCEETNMLYIEA